MQFFTICKLSVMGESLYSTMFSSPIISKLMTILDDDDDYWDQVFVMLIDQRYFTENLDPSSSEEEEEEPSDFGGISDSSRGDDLPTSITDQENPAYAKCGDKPFPAYKDIEFLTSKTMATGRSGFSSGTAAAPTIDSSSSSSPDPLIPTAVPTTAGASASGSGHSSAAKRPRSPQPANPPRKHASLSGGRRKKSDIVSDAVAEMVKLSKQKLDLVRQIYQNEVTNRPNIPTINACMSRVYNLPGMTDEQILAACDALTDDKNRQLFMTMNDKLAFMWVDRQVAMQNNLYKRYFPGM
ncbi:uncharacterized protein LOC109722140 isoform X1 [Ananas comosus]|uniref:Uncharacterized protein LOC109722140 isoform X1 n=2 Tax=Ananas comosus TaxID=4615 RepID=A0A6P5GK13_ANACO|nr:uncharacterized protein LOC109722140 isoform X1 [Ananas comosus]